jgi:uncharacterized protein with ATP-grasp and redox domains
MKPSPECFGCFLKQSLIASRLAGVSTTKASEVQRSVARLLSRTDWQRNPPYIASLVFRTVYTLLDRKDPYAAVKREYNRKVKDLYPRLSRLVSSADDPFTTAVKLALAGNIIDFGILEEIDFPGTLEQTLALTLPAEKLGRIKSRVSDAAHILYLADNAGEIGLDYFLLAEIKKLNPGTAVTLAVKKTPVINDATAADARYFGLEHFARIIDTGGNRVGTHPALFSAPFKKAFAAADLIISKGQANWESLEDRRDPRFVFLLKAKCAIVAKHLNVDLNETVLDVVEKTGKKR